MRPFNKSIVGGLRIPEEQTKEIEVDYGIELVSASHSPSTEDCGIEVTQGSFTMTEEAYEEIEIETEDSFWLSDDLMLLGSQYN